MRARGILFWLVEVSALGVLGARAYPSGPQASTQQNVAPASASASASATATLPASGTVVPRLVQFSDTLADATGKPTTGNIAITFSLYALQDGGTPLWSETQTIALDSQGHYTAFLGAASPDGLPLDLFASGAARWLGVAPALPGIGEQPRVLLVGVPYALKAADADTLGGLPASAFVQSGQGAGAATSALATPTNPSAGAGTTVRQAGQTTSTKSRSSSTGVAAYLPYWNGTQLVGSSQVYQSGSNIGIGTTSPSQQLQLTANELLPAAVSDTSGNLFLGGDTSTGALGLRLFSADSSGGAFIDNRASTTANGIIFRTDTHNGGTERMRITAGGNVGIGTTAPAAMLEVNGTAKFDQAVTFAAGQTFPNTASLLSNMFTGNQSVTGSVIATQSGAGSAVSAANTAASGETVGAQGIVSAGTGTGVLGVNVNASATGGQHPGYTGVWGDSGQSGNDGVLGTADDGFAMVAYNNSPGGDAPLYVENLNTGSGLPLIKAVAGNGTTCIVVNSDGNSFCQGTHSTVVPVDGRQLALYPVEAPENWFEDFGSATLSGGMAAVRLEPEFAATVNTGMEYHVFLTPKGDCEGLFVTNETPAGFEVRELRHGQSNVAFDYRIVAKRKGYEGVRLADETKEMESPAPGAHAHAAVALRGKQL
jgi:hypothetical protein